MSVILGRYRAAWALLIILVVVLPLQACSKSIAHPEKNFVGVWKSSRTNTPVNLYSNGEWEIKSDEGKVMQYGVWQLVGKDNIMWSYNDNGNIKHEVNAVLSIEGDEFKVRELDNSTTTFTRVRPTGREYMPGS